MIRFLIKGLLRDHLRVEETALANSVFPDSALVPGLSGLVTAA